jgi:1,4-alpha-glucan branching enzyme
MTGEKSGAGDTSRRRRGVEIRPEGGVRFRLWAPAHERISLSLEPEGRLIPTRSIGEGWRELTLDEAAAGTLYRFVLPDGLKGAGSGRALPAAGCAWAERGDRSRRLSLDRPGRPWHEAVLYELHVGAFTEEGAFRAAIGRLDRLAKLGVTAPAISMGPIHHQPSAEGLHRQEQG